MKLVIDHILKLQNYIQSLEALQIDSEEFAYLKALVLFSPGKWITVESLNFLWGPIFVDFRFFLLFRGNVISWMHFQFQ